MPLVSVIVVNWNGRHLLEECLHSLRRQTLPDLEIILVDNGSSDGSLDLVRSRFPEVAIVGLDRNLGFAGGSNRGMTAARGDFIALVNNDAVAESRWAEALIRPMHDARVGIVASRVLLYDDRERLDSAGDGMTTVGAAFKHGHLQAAARYARRRAVFGASGCGMLLRRSLLEDVGSLDEDFHLIYEDADLCFRARLRGWECLYEPEAVLYHRVSATIGRLSSTHVYYGQRNVEQVYFKNMPSRLLWRYLPAHMLNALLAAAYFAARGRAGSYIRAKADFLRSFRNTLRKRGEIQARRSVPDRDLQGLLEKRWLRPRLAGK